jgi:hypothetical protein
VRSSTKVKKRQTSTTRRRADPAAHVAQQLTDTLSALALARLEIGRVAFGSEPTLFCLLRAASLRFPAISIALGSNARCEFRHKLPIRRALDEATQVGNRAADAFGLQPAGEFVEKDLTRTDGTAQQALCRIALLRQ